MATPTCPMLLLHATGATPIVDIDTRGSAPIFAALPTPPPADVGSVILGLLVMLAFGAAVVYGMLPNGCQ